MRLSCSATLSAFAFGLFLLFSGGCGGGGGSKTVVTGPTPTPTPTATPTPTPSPTPTPIPTLPGRVVATKANDVIYDRFNGKLYVSVPSTDTNNGNSVVPVDPATGNLGTAVFVGSEPGQLALSDDGAFLYVALNGAAAVRRINLASGSPDQQIVLGADSFFGPYYAGDMAVAPGHPDWLSVVRISPGISPATRNVALFINGAQAPNSPDFYQAGSRIAFGASASRLYGYDDETSGFSLYRLAVDTSGLTPVDARGNIIGGYGVGIVFDGGRLYSNSGRIIDPEAGTLIATLSEQGAICPDGGRNRVYVANAMNDGTANVKLSAFDATRFTPVAVRMVPLSTPSGGSGFASVTRVVRWGAGGLAFRTGDGRAVIVDNAAL